MANTILNARIILKHGTAEEWAASSLVLLQGELGLDTTCLLYTSYQQELRHLSRSLYGSSAFYRRLIQQSASQIDLMCRSVVPITAPDAQPVPEQILARTARTLEKLQTMDLPHEFHKLYLTAWLEDAAYGCVCDSAGGF